MGSFLFKFVGFAVLVAPFALAQVNPASPDAATPAPAPPSAPRIVEPLMPLRITSSTNLTSDIGAVFMPPVKCDADGNLYIRKFALNRPHGPVIKVDPSGKPTAVFDPAVFASLALDRVDAFSPAPDGGIYQVAQSGITKPRMYVLHYSSDGTPASPTRLDADFEIYTFAAFPDGSFLISGVQRDPMDKNDHGTGVTEVFSADGRELAKLSFPEPKAKSKPKPTSAPAPKGADTKAADLKPVDTTSAKAAADPATKPADTAIAAPTPPPPPATSRPANANAKPAGALDLKDAEISRDGNLYVMRTSSQALVDVISPAGKIMKTLKIAPPASPAVPNSFHVSENRIALLFEDAEQQTVAIAVVDAQTGRKIAAYSGSTDFGSFACYSANDGVFTFLKHGDGNTLELNRAEAQ